MRHSIAIAAAVLSSGLVGLAGAAAAHARPPAAPAAGASLKDDENAAPLPEAQIPAMKTGQWRITMAIVGRKAQTADICMQAHPVTPPREGRCDRFATLRTAAGVILSSNRCTDDRGVVWTVLARTYGDFNASYAQDGGMRRKAPGRRAEYISGHTTYQYLGPCRGDTPGK